MMSQPKSTFYIQKEIKGRLDAAAESSGIAISNLASIMLEGSLDVFEETHKPPKQIIKDGLRTNSEFIKKIEETPKKTNKKKKKDKPN
jgi:antitoxin component of RelBE/YafQ-DinJ toxin-antitoxin module